MKTIASTEKFFHVMIATSMAKANGEMDLWSQLQLWKTTKNIVSNTGNIWERWRHSWGKFPD